MRAVAVTPSHSLADIDLAVPHPVSRDLQVAVHAVSVNPVDTKVRRSSTEPQILGWDAAGAVVAVGPNVTHFRPGDAVYYAGSIARPGTNAEFHLVDERLVSLKPKSLNFEQAAALPLTSLTAWECLHDRLKVTKGSLLIIGGAGGVGSMTIQLAKLAGLHVIATASRPETIDWCRSMGADEVIDHRKPLTDQLKAVDYIANFAHTSAYWEMMAELIAPQGAICCIVDTDTPIDLNLLKQKSATFAWEFMFTRGLYETPDMGRQGEILAKVADLIDAKQLRTTLTEVLRPINAATLTQAHARIESGKGIGKLVVAGWPAT